MSLSRLLFLAGVLAVAGCANPSTSPSCSIDPDGSGVECPLDNPVQP